MSFRAITFVHLGKFPDAETAAVDADRFCAAGEWAVTAALGALPRALVYQEQGRLLEGEAIYKKALFASEAALAADPAFLMDQPVLGTILSNLSVIYVQQGRLSEAEELAVRAVALLREQYGSDHPDTLNKMHNLAMVYWAQQKLEQAGVLFEQVVAGLEKRLGPEHPDLWSPLLALADYRRSKGLLGQAEAVVRRVLAGAIKLHGEAHPSSGTAKNRLGLILVEQGHHREAAELFVQAHAILEKSIGESNALVLAVIGNIVDLHFRQGNWREAAEWLQRGTESIIRAQSRTQEVSSGKLAFGALVKALHRVGSDATPFSVDLMPAAFLAAQRATVSSAASSLSMASARLAQRTGVVPDLIREREALPQERGAREKLLMSEASKPWGQRNAQLEREHHDRIEAIDVRLREVDDMISVRAPSYALLLRAQPLPVPEVQTLLQPMEALILILDTSALGLALEETFIWVVTRDQHLAVRAPMGTRALQDDVATLRCGLDRAGQWAWSVADQRWRARHAACARLRPDGLGAGEPMPFDTALAHRLYASLLGPFEDLISGKHLLVVSSGPLSQLPLQVLVTKAPSDSVGTAPAADTQWLGARQPVSTLPSVSSLKALRTLATGGQAPRGFIGFGNPLLEGDPSQPDQVRAAAAARNRTACGGLSRLQPTARTTFGQLAAPLFRGGLADVAQLRRAAPLPETADEVCEIAAHLGAGDGDIWLGARATEANIKRLSADGQLAQYRVVHFATHGLVAGEFKGLAEPALVLTPPAEATEQDDGLLAASEVAQLKLNADWVVLSACNTAAAGAQDAEALSGLARAFFYAGARALLVSHWEVNSDAAVKLTTGAFAAMAADPSIGRAEAMRRSMVSLITSGNPREAHPSHWAPFVIVGEGGTPADVRTFTVPPAPTLPAGGPAQAAAPVPTQAASAVVAPQAPAARIRQKIAKAVPRPRPGPAQEPARTMPVGGI